MSDHQHPAQPDPADAIRGLHADDQRHQGRAATEETGPITAERLTAVEACAVSIRAWNASIIPGPLQLTRYAAAAIRTRVPTLEDGEVMRRAHARAARVDSFLRRWASLDHVGQAMFFVGEQALRQPLANDRAHGAQLRYLANLAESNPRIDIRIVLEGRLTPGRSGQFALYGLRGAGLSRLGYLESVIGGWYTVRAADVARLHSAFETMAEAALSPDDSRTFMTEVSTAWG
ncbi:DUF5753 domain-containing protein [Streptomyces sp. NPDC088733]|uniref:DUF5753 domain-containing protein n=1 Tax=Streptomyces sp. NPDC088733 TaxID=3365880 RepID=UPI00380E4319